ncbi:D-alanyl-D-alanine carboxypeptidase family protein [Saccharibacillus sp. JS10]|uniref:M15 family metallopeptidase n=1 Tax=Saccharibacillus sp. JS10 TaxID=2950552 RepID=UPI00210CA136|nr:M15 family metallopeptidase [Saccharibacillus sp. JS10]MCQ4087861.1 M15 family metallopeptidase [Saccharibacillus sp. JS10]
MKKWMFATIVIALLLTITIFKLAEQRGWIASDSGISAADGIIQEIALQSSGQSLEVSDEELYSGDLLLVNSEYPIHPPGTQPDVTKLFGNSELTGPAALLDSELQLSRRVALKFVVMVDAAAQDGVSRFLISSGYRDEREQSRLYKEKGAEYALSPGYSEHHLGLALDIGSTEGTMAEAKEGQWLAKHAAQYGFVLRYPAHKVGITGISFEPWHFRYVGLPHSVLMQKNDMVLEEYLNRLQDQSSISTTIEGKKYEVYYYAPDQLTKLKIPNNRDYALSGDNRGGLILTVYP